MIDGTAFGMRPSTAETDYADHERSTSARPIKLEQGSGLATPDNMGLRYQAVEQSLSALRRSPKLTFLDVQSVAGQVFERATGHQNPARTVDDRRSSENRAEDIFE